MNNVDPSEINKFRALSSRWWDETGDLKSLHDINPLRLQFIKDNAPLAQAKIIDIGCGGGILTESLAQSGAQLTGIDMNDEAINVAKLHAEESDLQIDYQVSTAENIAKQLPEQFDIITCMELLEHVPEPAHVIQACATLLKPGGKVFFSTINRTLKAYLQAVIAGEYILQLLPKGTHDYAKLIRPSELNTWCEKSGLAIKKMMGMTYNPLSKQYKLIQNISVNYLVYAEKQR
ncbi:MAG: bifunctional 2-polyprenyl-6-hydroxyphenol methylase/3-demethylubiquinol 3-O-methyltransferase UbiG [Gammaproteobacteria bacterium]